jgi:membrane-bound lytic murein transglycosylase D
MMLYTARKGDTLVTIADRFGVSLVQLRRWNKINGIKVEPGRRLRVAEPAVAATHTAHSHRRGAAAAGAKTHAEARENGAGAKPAEPAAQKKTAPAAAKRGHAQSAKGAAEAGKSGTRSRKSSNAQRPAAHSKAHAPKQK